MKVASRGLQVLVAQQQLNRTQICTGIQKVGCERMPKDVRAEALLNPSFLAHLLAHLSDRGLMDREARLVAGEQPVLWLAPAPVSAQQIPPLWGEDPLFWVFVFSPRG